MTTMQRRAWLMVMMILKLRRMNSTITISTKRKSLTLTGTTITFQKRASLTTMATPLEKTSLKSTQTIKMLA